MMLSPRSQSALKPWEVVPGEEPSSMNVADLFSAMPGYEHRHVLLHVCWLFLSSYSVKVSLVYQTESAKMERAGKWQGHLATHLSGPSKAVSPTVWTELHWHPRQGRVETSQGCRVSCHSQPPPNRQPRKQGWGAGLATIWCVFLYFKYPFYEMLLRNKQTKTLSLFSLGVIELQRWQDL